jgi:DNA-binding transcriptional regulator LsrR (DeoR family)
MEHLVTALVARRYYVDGQTKSQIADELGISRFKVARILDTALRDGIVRIEIAIPPEVDLELGRQLEERFGLRQAIVVSTEDEPEAMRRQLGRACASLLAQRLTDADLLGVSWGLTLHALADVVHSLPRAGVLQMVGSIPTADLNVNSLELLRRLGQSTGGPTYPLHVPMILDSVETAAALRSVGHVASTLARFPDITCALVGIGVWRPGGSSVRGALSRSLVEKLDRAGAVADVCSTVLDRDGRVVGGETVAARCIAITTDQLRAIPDVIALAGGADKIDAIRATARAGLIHRLITDTGAAQALLEDLPQAPQAHTGR